MARVLKGSHTFTCTPTRSSAIGMNHTCLCLPSRSWYSFTDPGGMEAKKLRNNVKSSLLLSVLFFSATVSANLTIAFDSKDWNSSEIHKLHLKI